jgi:hypothetical protein
MVSEEAIPQLACPRVPTLEKEVPETKPGNRRLMGTVEAEEGILQMMDLVEAVEMGQRERKGSLRTQMGLEEQLLGQPT